MTARPERLVYVAGTGTEIGKTWIAAAVARRLRTAGIRVAARKPVQSFAAGDRATDADVLAAATGEAPEKVCPSHRWYGRALAPPMAAEALGAQPFCITNLVDELAWSDDVTVGLVEGVGGPRSPIATDGDNVALAEAIAPDGVLLVADAELGTINLVRMAIDAFAELPTVVVFNRYDGDISLHRANRTWLMERDGFDVLDGPEAVSARLGE